MIESNPTNVSSAFEMLLEEVEVEIDFVNGIGSRAFESREYDKAKEALERAGALTAYRDRIVTMRKEWEDLTAVAEHEEDDETRDARRNLGRLGRGLRTPEAEYYAAILDVLKQMGGSGKVADVLDRVKELMKPTLKDVDYEPLASSPDNPRWRNTAQWARNSMIKEGLLKGDSPRGKWEITDKGRQVLGEQR